MRPLLHPSRRALQDWLVGEGDPKVDSHVAICQRCAAVLEDLDSQPMAPLTEVLAVAFAPPTGLSDRLQERVAARLDSRAVLDVISDLFAAGIETSRLLIMEESEDDE